MLQHTEAHCNTLHHNATPDGILTLIMMIDLITFNSSLVLLIEGSSNPCEFEFSIFKFDGIELTT